MPFKKFLSVTLIFSASAQAAVTSTPSVKAGGVTLLDLDERKAELDKAEHDKSEKERNSLHVFCESFDNIKSMAQFLNIDISKYDLTWPYLFQQLILENYKLIKSKITIYKKYVNEFFYKNPEILKIWIEKLKKIEDKVEFIYKTGPWMRGCQIIKQLLSGKNPHDFKKSKKEHLNNIILIVWGYHLLASLKNQNFIGGVFNFEGKEIYDFIVSYPDAYDRSGKTQSSHYHEIDSRKFFGIDIPLELRGTLTLPNNKFHILIGNINHDVYLPSNKKVMFMLKPEYYGTKAFRDIIGHTGTFIYTQFTKNNKIHMRREHIPTEIYDAFAKLCDAHLGLSEIERSLYLKNVKSFGIKAVVRYMNLLIGDSTEQKAARRELQELLKDYDHLELRKGREVIITSEEINKSTGLTTITSRL